MPRLWPEVAIPPDIGRIVILGKAAIARIEAFLPADNTELEAGGILLGLRRDPHIEIVDATLPGKSDKRSRYAFIRRSPEHQIIATRVWQESGHVIDYVGEWHSHPERHPHPSAIDRAEILRRSLEHGGEPLVDLIVGSNAVCVALSIEQRYVPMKRCA